MREEYGLLVRLSWVFSGIPGCQKEATEFEFKAGFVISLCLFVAMVSLEHHCFSHCETLKSERTMYIRQPPLALISIPFIYESTEMARLFISYFSSGTTLLVLA